jgi:hypothetical protein
MNTAAATRLPKELGMTVRDTTPFTIHSSLTHAKGLVIDFTEHRIRRLLLAPSTQEIVLTLTQLLNDYTSGAVVVAWHHGTPCAVPITKDNM